MIDGGIAVKQLVRLKGCTCILRNNIPRPYNCFSADIFVFGREVYAGTSTTLHCGIKLVADELKEKFKIEWRDAVRFIPAHLFKLNNFRWQPHKIYLSFYFVSVFPHNHDETL